MVACYNRVEITVPNLRRLIEALDSAGADYQVFLLDDASPDHTGARIREVFPQVTVIGGTGSLFWNRGMRHLHAVARRHGPWSGYLLFNDDVVVDAASMIDVCHVWIQLNREQPTTLVGATCSAVRPVTTYAAYRRRNRHRPFALDLIAPGEHALAVDTFNGNFVLIPGATLDAIDAFDPIYVHSFGDLDLGYQIKRRGERVMLAPGHVGTCEDRPGSSRSRHGLWRRLAQGLSGRENPAQHIHFIWKHSPNRAIAIPVIAGMLVKRLWVLCANKEHVYPGSTDAAEGAAGQTSERSR